MFDSKYVLSIILDGNWRVSGDDESEELGFSSVEDMFIYVDGLLEKGVDIDTQNDYEKWLKILGQYVKSVQEDRQSITNDEIKRINDLYIDFRDTSPYGFTKATEGNTNNVGELIESGEKNTNNLDLAANNIDGDMTQAIAKTNERIDNIIGAENKEQNNGNLVSANKPNVTDAKLKIAAAPLPFVKVIKNNQLSTSPKSYNGLPPEIAAMIS